MMNYNVQKFKSALELMQFKKILHENTPYVHF